MTATGSSQDNLHAEDKLAGLYFSALDRGCCFRAECGVEFNHPLDPRAFYALIDPETNECVGLYDGETVIHPGQPPPPRFRVYFLRPLLEDRSFDHLSEDDRLRLIAAAYVRRLLR